MCCALLFGCGVEKAQADAGAEPDTAVPNFATGRVTMADGSPLTGDVADIAISISGVSTAGERVSYTPIVRNGRFRQRLAPGQYSFQRSTVTLRFEDKEYRLALVPVGNNWSKNQDAADGIVQDFIWKPTGRAETYGDTPDPNNHTHWHGMHAGMRFAGWREDLNALAQRPPAGTKLTFTLTPLSKSIDGRTLQPIVFVREWRTDAGTPNDDLNDFPPANYDITGFAQLPDGTTKPIVFQGAGNYPNFVTRGKIPLTKDNILGGGYWKQPFTWAVN